MYFRPGSLMAAFGHGYALMRKAVNPTVEEVIVVFHKPSHNYSSLPTSKWQPSMENDFTIVARIYKHSGPELSNLNWDVRP